MTERLFSADMLFGFREVDNASVVAIEVWLPSYLHNAISVIVLCAIFCLGLFIKPPVQSNFDISDIESIVSDV